MRKALLAAAIAAATAVAGCGGSGSDSNKTLSYSGFGAAAFLVASLVDWPWHLAGSGAIWALCVGALLPFSSQQGAQALKIQGDHS